MSGASSEPNVQSAAAASSSTNDANEEEKKELHVRQKSPSDVRIVDRDQMKEIQKVKASEEFEEALMAQAMQERDQNDVRIAVIGNVDSGKSTMVGVLTKSIMDDGRGSARQKVFNFSHEAQNGRTSSIGQEIMGFDVDNNQVQMEHQNTNKNQSWAHIAQNS